MQEPSNEIFYCPVEGCPSTFKRKEHLVRHSKSHSDVRPWICDICSKGFARSDVLRRHIKQHEQKDENSTGQPQNACDLCHIRKSRCDGANPCEACAKRNVPCTRSRTISRYRSTRGGGAQDCPSEGSSTNSAAELGNDIGTLPLPATPHEEDSWSVSDIHQYIRPEDPVQHTVLESIFSPATLQSAWQSSMDSDTQHSPYLQLSATYDFSTVIPQASLHNSLTSQAQATPTSWYTNSVGSLPQAPTPSLPVPQRIPSPRSPRPNLSVHTRRSHSNSPSFHPAPSTTRQIQPQSRASLQPPVPNPLDHSSTSNSYNREYFITFHPRWPILHAPSYHVVTWGPELIWSIVAIGARCIPSISPSASTAHPLAQTIHEELMTMFDPEAPAGGVQTYFASVNRSGWNDLFTLQAALLNVLYAVYFGADTAEIARGRRVSAYLVQTMHGFGVLGPSMVPPRRPGAREESLWKAWAEREAWKRLGQVVFEVDLFFLHHTDAELVASGERKLGFRVDEVQERLWSAETEEEWGRVVRATAEG